MNRRAGPRTVMDGGTIMTTATNEIENRSERIRVGGELEIHRMGFGAMRLTGDGVWGEPDDPENAHRVLRRAVEIGIDFIDTADSYGPDVNEIQIREALHPYPEHLVIATKGGQIRPGPGEWTPVGRPDHLRERLEGSLQRLGVERIDLYQHHKPDPDVPYAETIGALHAMQQEGLIRMLGVSNVSVEQLETAMAIADIVSVQNRYNLADRSSQAVLDRCEELGIAFLPWAPIDTGDVEGSAVQEVARKHDATPVQIALAWLLASSPVTVPIPGTSSIEHLEENVRATEIELDEEDLAKLG